MRRFQIFAVAAAVGLFAAFLGAASLSMDHDGKQVFSQQKCDLCHAVSNLGIEAKTKAAKLKGPDLTGLAGKFETEWIGKYLKREADLEGKKHLKPFKGSEEELQALVDWLLEQKAEE